MVGGAADDEKKKHCTVLFDTVDNKKQALEHSIAGLETRITMTEHVIAATKENIGALVDAIKALDRMPAEATEEWKEENENYTEPLAQDYDAPKKEPAEQRAKTPRSWPIRRRLTLRCRACWSRTRRAAKLSRKSLRRPRRQLKRVREEDRGE